jgi:hypothetical protein
MRFKIIIVEVAERMKETNDLQQRLPAQQDEKIVDDDVDEAKEDGKRRDKSKGDARKQESQIG